MPFLSPQQKPHRHALLEHLGQLLGAKGRKRARFGLLFLDLDGFRPINDRYGHATGDAVLKAMVGRINSCVRHEDFAARIGGDEFVVLLQDIEQAGAAATMAQRIRSSLAQPLMIDGQQIRVGASICMASYPADGATADALLTRADQMMYEIKRGGKAAPAAGERAAMA